VTNSLLIQGQGSSPNNGTQTTVATVTLNGSTLDFSAANGFDIPTGVNTTTGSQPVAAGSGLAALTVGGVTGLYSIDLVTGVATKVGNILTGGSPVNGFAMQTDTGGAPAIALSEDGTTLLRFNTATPTTTTSVAIGIGALAPGEMLVGIDFRPATGQLYALAIDAADNTGTLYLLSPSGTLTAVGPQGAIAFVEAGGNPVDFSASGWGVDFQPNIDRLRVTNDLGLNFRVNPNFGLPTDGDAITSGTNTDLPITGLPLGSTGITATAYANNSPGLPFTTQYTLDADSNSLFIQNTNIGTQTTRVQVTLGGAPLDFVGVAGFDIPAKVSVTAPNTQAAGYGYAALNVGGVVGLYRIDLTTGAATNLGNIGTGGVQLSGLTLADAPLNDAPIDIALSSASIQEFRASGTVVASLSTTDYDAGDAHTYALLNSAGGRFAIVGNELRVADRFKLDFEQAASHQITVRSTDQDGKFVDETFTITVANVNPEVITGNAAPNAFVGGIGNDRFSGLGGNDTLKGQGGADTLTGGAGKDTLLGAAGFDKLIGGFGRDVMTGGGQRDVFDFNAVADTGKTFLTRDVIRDFSHAQGDDIDLSTIDAMTGPGNQKFAFIGQGAFTGVKGQLHYKFEGPARTIIEGDINGDKKADFQIELTGHKLLVAGDFIL
jgi:hypothetical protein